VEARADGDRIDEDGCNGASLVHEPVPNPIGLEEEEQEWRRNAKAQKQGTRQGRDAWSVGLHSGRL
jgi:hypothetical protein